MGRLASLVYGLLCYALFLVVFLYAIGFVGNVIVPKSIDTGLPTDLSSALLCNVFLLSLFAVQHTIMARPAFKQVFTKIVPQQCERSTFVLMASLCLATVFWKWMPLPTLVWNVEQPIARNLLWALFAIGWLIVLLATFMINHFELFGLQQVVLHFVGRQRGPEAFTTRGFYKYIRHPIMAGFLIAFWATPQMSQGHLLFAVVTTGYILFGITMEERDLIRAHPETYNKYRAQVSMLVPWKK